MEKPPQIEYRIAWVQKKIPLCPKCRSDLEVIEEDNSSMLANGNEYRKVEYYCNECGFKRRN